jgi:hypothetical protein
MKTYFLFGKEACDCYEFDPNTDEQRVAFIRRHPHSTFVYDSDFSDPEDLLNEYDGFYDYCKITENFYKLLTNQL